MKRITIVASLLVLALLLHQSRVAVAGDSYGTDIAIGDGVATAILVAAVPSEQTAVWIAGVVAFAGIGPTIHLSHRRYGIAATSLGLRVGAPMILGWIGSTFPCEGFLCELGGMLIGGVVGMGIAATVDWFVLASGDDEPRTLSFPLLGGRF